MARPLISVGMPVWNGERFMSASIESILAQTCTDFELIISDNHSTDGTEELARHYVSVDPRVRYVRNARNLGAARNYNQLVDLARGRYFKWAGYDDLLLPSHLERCAAALERHPDAVIAYPRTVIIDEHGACVRDHVDDLHLDHADPVQRVRHFIGRYNLCNPCFGLQRREVMLRTSRIQPFVSSDVPYLVEMAMQGTWLELPDRLFLRRIHATSSRQGQLTLHQVAQWFHPENGRPLAPRTRVLVECVRSIERADAPASLRARAAMACLLTWSLRRSRVRAGQVRSSLRERATRTTRI